MIAIDGQIMLAIAPRFSGDLAARQRAIVDAIGPILAGTLANFAIDTKLRIAHFLGQTCVESAGFRTTEEFASGASYEGRKDLGNVKPGDGRRYKGRGLLQLTGRANYREFGKILGLDLEGDPDLAADPAISLQIACEYWRQRNINPACDRDDVVRVTKIVNGGLNGLKERRAATNAAKAQLAKLEPAPAARAVPYVPHHARVLRQGTKGKSVTMLQVMLRAKGFELKTDGSFGPVTETIVIEFQSRSGLTADGVVGPLTWARLCDD